MNEGSGEADKSPRAVFYLTTERRKRLRTMASEQGLSLSQKVQQYIDAEWKERETSDAPR